MIRWAFLQDEIPKFGSGWRRIEVLKKGWKWVRLRNPANGKIARIARRKWNPIEARLQEKPG